MQRILQPKNRDGIMDCYDLAFQKLRHASFCGSEKLSVGFKRKRCRIRVVAPIFVGGIWEQNE